jgi:KUP system potassium uptake protein
VVEDLVKNKEVDITSKHPSLNKNHIVGDFRFVLLEKVLSRSNKLPFLERFIMNYYFILHKLSLSEEKGFGLDSSFVKIERVPLMVSVPENIILNRIK